MLQESSPANSINIYLHLFYLLNPVASSFHRASDVVHPPLKMSISPQLSPLHQVIIIIIIITIGLQKSFVGHAQSPGPSTAFYPGLLDATFSDADLGHLASGF